MNLSRGFTLIEFMTVVALIGILAAVFTAGINRNPKREKSATKPYNNEDDIVCKGGYKFTGRDSRSAQILDNQGHGIPCQAQ